MIGQKLLNSLNATIIELEHVVDSQQAYDLVDLGARLRASVAALKSLSDACDDKIKPLCSVQTPLTGVNFRACLTSSVRHGIDVKGLRMGLPEGVWKPYETETSVISMCYKPR